MKAVVEKADGYSVLGKPISIIIEQEADVACDSMKAVFVDSEDLKDIRKIYMLDDDVFDIENALNSGEVLFSGVVDEIITDISRSGSFVTVYARSLACLLTDSECSMMTYRDPSFGVLAERHGKPFGLSVCSCNPKTRKGSLSVKKGSSHYKVIQRFCREFMGTVLRVDHKGVIRHDLFSNGNHICFDNNSGIPFGRITISENRYSIISRIDVYDENGYCMSVDNPDAVKSGISRIRCLNLPESATQSVGDADRIIKQSNDKSFSVRLECLDCLVNSLGYAASVNIPLCKDRKLYVVKVKYTYDNKGERTEIWLASRGDR